MNNTDKEYFRLLNTILEKGRLKKNRTGINTIGVFGEQAKYEVDLNAFPILTTKKVWFKGILHELLWFIKGDTNIKYLVDNDVGIWNEWAYKRYTDNFAKVVKQNMGATIGNTCFTQTEFIHTIKTDAEFAAKWGELGEGTYGGMWRAFPYNYINTEMIGNGEMILNGRVDQLQKIIDKLKTNPDDRRMIVSAWHPYWVDHCALPPCHCLFHFNTEELTLDERRLLVSESDLVANEESSITVDRNSLSHDSMDMLNIPKRKLNCLLYQRSVDSGLGLPYNITSYCLLTAMIAQVTNMISGTFTHTYGDLHIYTNHIEQLKLQLTKEPYDLPKLWLNPEIKSLFDFKYDDVKLIDYKSHPTIKMDVAV